MVDGAHDVRMLGGEAVGDAPACASREPSLTAMISNVVGERGQRRQGLLDEALEVGLLVVGGEEVRQAGDPWRQRVGRLRQARSWLALRAARHPEQARPAGRLTGVNR